MVLVQLNNHKLKRINNYQAHDRVIFGINNVEISLSKSFAIAISEYFYSQYLLDKRIEKIQIYVEIRSNDTYNTLKDIFEYQKDEIECDEVILKDLFNIGRVLGVQKLIKLYKRNFIDPMTEIDKDHCIQLLEFYFETSENEKIIESTEFISSHFYEIDTNKLKLISQKLGIDILQRILCSDKLEIEDEDSLADFIISLVREDRVFSPLFKNICLEFCKETTINEIIDTADENNFHDVIKSFADSLLRRKDSQPRACKHVIEYFKSGNVEMSASSILFDGSLGYINSYTNTTQFAAQNKPYQWVQWRIKENYSI
ncbi:hypothetical protein TVAG_194230 [Trichomonas vaginalis G3]|uniref:BTB domain-containing protein n=1 Tax=Trichomonas vaginalis (strain ATCC PRA-98 / G3) TaxID=412133 RepID=A2ES94_TRIV3|nr:spectrin binding [Trichomonas vaginalis G3]EAY04458.1 hypothetical protein TVAG_194230 [Trichomonas vaginalis G3]KAI5510284.1 spectrin binding [Trichomonas vaginalis G3]|eukprot:XP_001316681.1 hypothetical protein [Trichomonas vaginalis G3]